MWETVIGLEVHCELSTKSKIFCGCSAAFGGEPNTKVCPVCAGLPGALPKLNKQVVEYALRAGLALNCNITQNCRMDRKNYFYPDLPKAYQVSQLYYAICKNGYIDICADGKNNKRITLHQIHMEEDAGKLIHEGNITRIDCNRGGVPLLEIVSNPDMRNADEAIAYVERLREILLFLGVSDCKMQEGSLRVDVNLSVRKQGAKEYGVRTETKNLNSLRSIVRAIEFERDRQIEVLESGGSLFQETRRWDDNKGIGYGMRSKANAHDYRYFPDPDFLPISISDKWLSEVKKNLPELAHQKRDRFVGEMGLSEYDAGVITSDKKLCDLFEQIATISKQPKEASNLVTGDILRLQKASGNAQEDISVDGKKLAVLVDMVTGGKISRNAYKQSVEAVFEKDVDPNDYVAKNNLMMVSDDKAARAAAKEIVAANPNAVADYKNGIAKSFGFLMGQLMKKLGGTASPDVARKVLTEELEQ